MRLPSVLLILTVVFPLGSVAGAASYLILLESRWTLPVPKGWASRPTEGLR